MEYKFDATNKVLGRLATEVAVALRGKNNASFDPRKIPNITVEVRNLDKLRVSEKKLDTKIYYRHSGYVGRLKSETLRSVFKRDSREVFRRALVGMLPKNRLRARLMKRVTLIR